MIVNQMRVVVVVAALTLAATLVVDGQSPAPLTPAQKRAALLDPTPINAAAATTATTPTMDHHLRCAINFCPFLQRD